MPSGGGCLFQLIGVKNEYNGALVRVKFLVIGSTAQPVKVVLSSVCVFVCVCVRI